MITFGTDNYKKSQQIANDLQGYARISRRYSRSSFDLAFDKVANFMEAVKALDCFAAKVAATVEGAMNPYAPQVARISDKQAWCLACAAVENNIEF